MTEPIYSIDDEDFIGNEEFNFDLPVSPPDVSSKDQSQKENPILEDEDEVFFGPVGFKEQCVSKKTSDAVEDAKPLSPLTTEQFVEIFKEANSLAIALQEETDSKKPDEPINQLADSMSELALKSQQQSSGDTVTPNRSETEKFKRAVKKDMRSPRRSTYVISVSPAGQPPPAHLPTAEECVSSLTKDRPSEIKFTAEKATEIVKKNPKAAVKKSRLPAKRSGIPKTSGLRKPTAVSYGVKKMSPPKRARLNSGESAANIPIPISPALSDASDVSTASTDSSILCRGKRLLPGSNNPIKNGSRGLRKTAGTGLKVPTASKDGTKKQPASKPSLVKPGVLPPRKTLAVARPSKLGATAGASKLQPMKATYGLKAAAKTGPAGGKVTPQVKAVPPRMRTPLTTPVFQDKKVVPKRIMSSSCLNAAGAPTPRTTRAFSVDSAVKPRNPPHQAKTPQLKKPSLPCTPTPIRKPSLPGTPQASGTKASALPVTGSARRRSGIPTPMRSSVSSSVSRISSTSSMPSYHSPRTLPKQGRMSRIPSPLETPPPPQFSPNLPTEGANDNNGASPEFKPAPMMSPPVVQHEPIGASPEFKPAPVKSAPVVVQHEPIMRTALTEIQAKHAPSPQLINLDTPKEHKVANLLDLSDTIAYSNCPVTEPSPPPSSPSHSNATIDEQQQPGIELVA